MASRKNYVERSKSGPSGAVQIETRKSARERLSRIQSLQAEESELKRQIRYKNPMEYDFRMHSVMQDCYRVIRIEQPVDVGALAQNLKLIEEEIRRVDRKIKRILVSSTGKHIRFDEDGPVSREKDEVVIDFAKGEEQVKRYMEYVETLKTSRNGILKKMYPQIRSVFN